MKITFEHQKPQEIVKQSTPRQSEGKSGARVQSQDAFFKPDTDRDWIAGTGVDKGKTMSEIQQAAANTDAAIQQDYRTVMANTMSAEDYAQMEREGFRFEQMDPETAVTIVDKIKAELARSGQYIAGYTDDLDMDTLAAALGSDTLANAVAESFRAEDVPLTKENIEGVKQAWDMASRLEEPSQDTYRYMVDNEMEPEIRDYYLAQSSTAGSHRQEAEQGRAMGKPKFFPENVQGYYAKSAYDNSVNDGGEHNQSIQEQIDRLLVREGLEANEENRQTAGKILEEGLPLTKENVVRHQQLGNVEFPVTEEKFAAAAAKAVAEGKSPAQGRLTKSESIYEKAAALLAYYESDAPEEWKGEDLTARRQLEEIRLRMTAEVNVKLLDSGFAIDTAPMEELVEALRKAEAEVAQSYFPRDAEAVEKYQTFHNACEVIKDLPGLPAGVIGPLGITHADWTLEDFHNHGKAIQTEYEKAQENYEALMTAPRADLGDSIRKAFANVDDILADMGLEISKANQRAVRILGYNRMGMNEENIERVKAADSQVQSVIRKMTPASTLQMIRDGVNPLTANFEELEQYFDNRDESFEESSESYSRFLYGLEQNKEITEQERESYIGIYRMLHQIENTDGAAVGALVNTGAELHFSNLLSAVRSGRFKSLDVSVTEEFGETVEVIRKGKSISDQIGKGFVENAKELLTEMSHTEESEETYQKASLEQIRQAALVEEASVDMLLRGQIPRSAENLLAAQALTDSRQNPFKEWKDKKEEVIENLMDSMEDKEEFQKDYQEMVTTLDQQVQESALNEMESSVDVKGRQLLHKQLSVAGSMARQEEYIFPMYIGEELAKVHLSLEEGGEEKGTVHIALDLSEDQHMEARLYALEGTISGYLTGNTKEAVMKLQKVADIFIDSVQEDTKSDWRVTELPVTGEQRATPLPRRTSSVNREVPDALGNHREVDNTELYRIAKSFLRAVQK